MGGMLLSAGEASYTDLGVSSTPDVLRQRSGLGEVCRRVVITGAAESILQYLDAAHASAERLVQAQSQDRELIGPARAGFGQFRPFGLGQHEPAAP